MAAVQAYANVIDIVARWCERGCILQSIFIRYGFRSQDWEWNYLYNEYDDGGANVCAYVTRTDYFGALRG